MEKKADSFGHLSKPLAFWNPNSLDWKTSQLSLISPEGESLERLPPTGMTRNGRLYPENRWARPTSENGGFVWPTPTADSIYPRRRNYAQGGTPLTVAVWATPTIKGNWNRADYNSKAGDGLETQAADLQIATPTPHRLNPEWVEILMGYPVGWTSLEAGQPGADNPNMGGSRHGLVKENDPTSKG